MNKNISFLLILFLTACGGGAIEPGDSVSSVPLSSVPFSSIASTQSSESSQPPESSSSSSATSSSIVSALSCAEAKERGQALYEGASYEGIAQNLGCAECHGADAKDATFQLIDLEAPLYRHSSMTFDEPGLPLHEYLPLYMPPGGGQCDAECGEHLAVYLKSLGNKPWCPGDAPEVVAERREILPRVLHRLNN